jgi:diacylglycerol kinase family enzyme
MGVARDREVKDIIRAFPFRPRHCLLDGHPSDVTLVRPIRILPLLWHLPKVFGGTIDRVKHYATMKKTTKSKVESATPVPVHVDGEIYRGDTTTLEIEIVPKALTVIGNS